MTIPTGLEDPPLELSLIFPWGTSAEGAPTLEDLLRDDIGSDSFYSELTDYLRDCLPRERPGG